LVGKVLPHDKLLPGMPWAPNEIVALRADTLFVLRGSGWIAARLPLPPLVWDVAALLDTLAPLPRSYSPNLTVIALQSVEHRRPDSLVATYIIGARGDSLAVVRRLILDMRPYAPNLAAALIPVAARTAAGRTVLYALVSSSTPTDTLQRPLPYFRGLTQFISDSLLPAFPVANLPDDASARLHYAPTVQPRQPSVTTLPGGIARLMLPLQADSSRTTVIVNRLGQRTRADSLYLVGIDLQGSLPSTGIAPVALPLDSATLRPAIYPRWVRLQPDPNGAERPFLLVAEEYPIGSHGIARLHLYDATGLPLAAPTAAGSPPFSGAANHSWSIAIADVDAPSSNTVPPFYPNNPGAEILATPNTPRHAVPGARLFVLRYRTDALTPKPQPPGTFLFPFDTIASAPCSGWLLAAADLDGDTRAELLLADRGTLHIWRLRNYADPRFSLGFPFDTLATFSFGTETITAAAVADLEGDGRTDILVRTDSALYCIGVPLLPTFSLMTPATDTTLCVTDTLSLQWVNHVRNTPTVRLSFQPYRNGTPYGAPRFLAELPNDSDTLRYALPARLLLPDTQGRLVLSGELNARDSTPILQLAFPSFTLAPPPDSVTVGDTLHLAFLCRCTDSLLLSATDTQSPLSLHPDSAGNATAALPVPCPAPSDCWSELPPWLVRVSARAAEFVTDTTLVFTRRPRLAPASFQLPLFLCPEIAIIRDTLCPTPTVGYSTDGGRSFTPLPPQAGSSQWLLPPAAMAADTLWLRLCCDPCSRKDTTLTLTTPAPLTASVAPNPVRFPRDQLSLYYSFPTETSARVRIVDAANNLIRELVPWRPHAAYTSYCEHWDGTTESGDNAATGTYYIVIEQPQQRWILPIFVYRQP